MLRSRVFAIDCVSIRQALQVVSCGIVPRLGIGEWQVSDVVLFYLVPVFVHVILNIAGSKYRNL